MVTASFEHVDGNWWASAHLRITHPQLSRSQICQKLQLLPTPLYGPKRLVAASELWKLEFRADYPDRPDVVLRWAESTVKEHYDAMVDLLHLGCDIDVYVGIHSAIVALGFEMPPMPTILNLGIRLGIEFFVDR